MLESLRKRLYEKYLDWRGVIWEDNRGGIIHRYTFKEINGLERARITRVPGMNARIQYHLTQYDSYGAGPEEIWLYLVEDTIHELTHWADNDQWISENGEEEHWELWREFIYGEIEYVNDFEIEYG